MLHDDNIVGGKLAEEGTVGAYMLLESRAAEVVRDAGRLMYSQGALLFVKPEDDRNRGAVEGQEPRVILKVRTTKRDTTTCADPRETELTIGDIPAYVCWETWASASARKSAISNLSIGLSIVLRELMPLVLVPLLVAAHASAPVEQMASPLSDEERIEHTR